MTPDLAYPQPRPAEFGRRQTDYALVATSIAAGFLLALGVVLMAQIDEVGQLKEQMRGEIKLLIQLRKQWQMPPGFPQEGQ